MKTFLLFLSLFFAMPVYAQTVEDGFMAYDAGEYEKAKGIFHALAEQGNAKAMNAIGLLYEWGKAYSHDRNFACDWYEKAAVQGYASAQYNFAKCFGEKGGRRISVKNYILWMEKAAEKKMSHAQIALMIFYSDKNSELSKKWGQQAINQGSTFALVAMWDEGHDYTGPKPTFKQIACVYVMNLAFQKESNYCQ